MKVRLSDIAARAEVSLSAVSLALQGKRGVSQETADRIKRAAKELGYTLPQRRERAPFVLFVKLVKHGNILNQDHQSFVSDYTEGLEAEGRRLELGLAVSTFALAEIDLPSVVAKLNASGCAGAVILATELEASDLEPFEALAVPFVVIDAYFEHLPFSFFDMNNADAVESILRYLYGQGHRRIGLVQGRPLSPNFRLREEAFREGLGRLGLAFRERDLLVVGSRFEEARAEARRAIEAAAGDLPTALFCVNDIVALGAMRSLSEAGIAIPGRISVVGFDDLGASAMSSPPLTTVRVPKRRIAARALRSLAEAIERGDRSSAEKTLVSGELVLRESAAPVLY